MLLDGKSAVITGAGSGVGRASALRFAEEGARVVCADLRLDWAKETVRQVEAAGGVAVADECDVSQDDQVASMIAAAGLLKQNAAPDETTIRQALAHHLCRCGTHVEILAAVRRAAELMRADA